MGNNNEEGKNIKNDKPPPSSATDMNNYVYPDWAAFQAFYGPRFPIPPYLNSNVASSPADAHYMWPPPQAMIPHYGAPYTAFYAHYAHPGAPMVGAAPNVESPAKSSGNSDGGFVKKLKEFDGLAMSIGNGSVDNSDPGTERRLSDSEATDGSSRGSNEGLAGSTKGTRKRTRRVSTNKDVSLEGDLVPASEVGQASDKSVVVTPSDASEKKSEKMSTSDVKNVKSSTTNVSQPVPSETWIQNERELKRERRKQSNRESARRSRLRKQAETEELANKVQALVSENMNMKSEINKLVESSGNLKHENAALMDKLNESRHRHRQRVDDFRPKPMATVNLLARVNNNSDPENEDGEVYESRSPPVKLHQLLGSSS